MFGRPASCIRYVDVLHVILPSDALYVTLASHVKRLQLADIICRQSLCVGAKQQNLKNTGLVKSQFGVQTQSQPAVANNAQRCMACMAEETTPMRGCISAG